MCDDEKYDVLEKIGTLQECFLRPRYQLLTNTQDKAPLASSARCAGRVTTM